MKTLKDKKLIIAGDRLMGNIYDALGGNDLPDNWESELESILQERDRSEHLPDNWESELESILLEYSKQERENEIQELKDRLNKAEDFLNYYVENWQNYSQIQMVHRAKEVLKELEQ